MYNQDSPEVDTSTATSARIYDVYLGGKTNFAPDRAVAEHVKTALPGIDELARDNRRWMHRTTRNAAEAGIRRFLDIGTGIPTAPNLHQVANSVSPDCKVVYVDRDSIVLSDAKSLMKDTTPERTAYLLADVRDPRAILDSAEVRRLLADDEPVALSLNALVHFITDEDDAYGLVSTLVEALPSGSRLIMTSLTADFNPEEVQRAAEFYKSSDTKVQPRSEKEFRRFFEGLELTHGVTRPYEYLPDADTEPMTPETSNFHAAVGIKP